MFCVIYTSNANTWCDCGTNAALGRAKYCTHILDLSSDGQLLNFQSRLL